MHRLASAGLTLLILVMAAIAIAMVAVPGATGTKAISVDRNSMQRVLPVGSLIYVKAQPSYAVGDYITYEHNGHRVTHEIVALLPNPATGAIDDGWVQTKGTENPLPDDYEVQKDHIVGKVVGHVPVLGLITKAVTTPVVAAFLLLVAGGLWWLSTSKPQGPEHLALAPE